MSTRPSPCLRSTSAWIESFIPPCVSRSKSVIRSWSFFTSIAHCSSAESSTNCQRCGGSTCVKLRLALIASMRARSVHDLPLGEYASSRIVLINRTAVSAFERELSSTVALPDRGV